MNFFDLLNLGEVEILYERFLQNPTFVDSSLRTFFQGVNFQKQLVNSSAGQIEQLIDAYRLWGHKAAHLSPLGPPPDEVEELKIQKFGFTPQDLMRSFPTCALLDTPEASLHKILGALKQTYTTTAAIQYKHCFSIASIEWLQERLEKSRFTPHFDNSKKIQILKSLSQASFFEAFLHTRYVGQKRFSLEGAETLIPMLQAIIEKCAEQGIREVIIGMPHRGRLNVLVTILKKSFSLIFSEFEDYIDFDLMTSAGDVKYHKGFSADVVTLHGTVHVALVANASHLESVDAIVLGKTLAKQRMSMTEQQMQVADHRRALSILIHGDAAIAGQGVVYETLQMAKLASFDVGGTLHLILNNQIGFTTLPSEGRSTPYPSDVAQAFGIPIFHINAEDPAKAVFIAELGLEMRNRFAMDIFIDLNCYRKYGHNEGDEPFFTQPKQYELIAQKKSIREHYLDQLIEEGVIEKATVVEMEEKFHAQLNEELKSSQLGKQFAPEETLQAHWSHLVVPKLWDFFAPLDTTVSKERLQAVAEAMGKVPADFSLHPKLTKLFNERKTALLGDETQASIDWANAELLAFGTLLQEGIAVRLAGQDSGRGTFSQRHALVVDQKSARRYLPLAHLQEGVRFEAIDTLLSEYGALGFEFGYSLADPKTLILWEAQYGDFVNGGQIIIDQYITCSEQKWNRFSGLVMLLPHGFEGQGSEHSSARLERFLSLSSVDNWKIAFPTTAAQYFHLLRRHSLQAFRKPLIILTPKSLLRYPLTKSSLQELMSGGYEDILDDVQPSVGAKRLILCSGKIYYDLQAMRQKKKADVVIVRVETLFPLHEKRLDELIGKYGAKQRFWVQEEPQNMGAWHYIQDRIGKKYDLEVVARPYSAAVASGSHALHVQQQEALVMRALYEN